MHSEFGIGGLGGGAPVTGLSVANDVPAPEGTQPGAKTVDAHPASPLSGSQVSIEPSKSPNLAEIRDEAAQRQEGKKGLLDKIFAFAKAHPVLTLLSSPVWLTVGALGVGVGLAVGALTVGTVAVGATATGVALIGAKLKEAITTDKEQAQFEANVLRMKLGDTGMPNGVMELSIPVPTTTDPSGSKSLMSLMNDYRVRLDSPLTEKQMVQYINMGERIAHALENTPGYEGGPLQVKDVDGRMRTVHPNTDTARALSWYMQAKAALDNASADREPVLLNRGSMVVADPEGKLHAFLSSSPTTYGRASTHFNERGLSGKATFGNSGLAGMLAGQRGQGAQLGIEDFDGKMPSGKGCLLFDKLRGENGERQIFMKWESVGMPTVFGGGVRADASEGASGAVINRFKSLFHCIGHAFNFLNTLTETEASEHWGVHREAANKGGAEPIMAEFTRLTADYVGKMGGSDKDAKAITSSAKNFGLDHMEGLLDVMRHDLAASNLDTTEVERLQKAIGEFRAEQGESLGIERRGEEVHAQLSTAYLG